MQQIKQGIYFEDGYLGVTLGALVLPFGTILIDAPLRPEDARSWRSSLINQRGSTNRVLISLDAHIDRTLGARTMECTIIAHQKAAQIYRNRPTIFKGQGFESGAEWETYLDAIGTRWATPDITFTDRLVLHWGGPDVLLEHHPGPTLGASWVIIPDEQIIFVGDAIVLNQPPFLANADLAPWIENVNLLATRYNNFLVISGRGGPVPNEVVRAQLKSLKSISKGLERLSRRNASPEATETLINHILTDSGFGADKTEQYAQRLRMGLYQYYVHHYRPMNQPADEGLENNSDYQHG
jgi:glyoxylase-like metal-dependent hydrolase (beta-lactamase superfamily II)